MAKRWKYYDRREWKVNGKTIKEQFAVVSVVELERAYSAGLAPNALCLWLVLLHRVNGRTDETYALGAQEISRRTGMSRATIYRAIAQLKEAGLVGSREEDGNKICWLSIPRSTDETQTAENNSGKLPKQSQICDKDTETGKSQKRNTATSRNSDQTVSNLRLDTRINLITKIKGGGNPELQRGKKEIPTEMIQVLYSKIAEDSEESLETLTRWREKPEQSAAQITRKRWKMRNGPDCSDLNLWGWYGTHRARDVALGIREAMEWKAGTFKKF